MDGGTRSASPWTLDPHEDGLQQLSLLAKAGQLQEWWDSDPVTRTGKLRDVEAPDPGAHMRGTSRSPFESAWGREGPAFPDKWP